MNYHMPHAKQTKSFGFTSFFPGNSAVSNLAAMPPLTSCERCGGPKRGRGQGYCINAECRKAAKEEKEQTKKEERSRHGAGSRGPKPGEGGRPAVPEAARRGPPYVGEDGFDAEQVRRSYRHFLRGWSKFGLSRVCQACGTLTPAKHCKEAKGTGDTLPTLPPIPVALQGLTNIERRLLAMAKWDQVIIDKLPSGGPSAQWGRMYAVLMGEPAICNAFEGAELGEDGTVWVEGVQGMTASSARLGQLYAALQALKDGHFSYVRNPAVVETLEVMQGVLEQLATTTRQPTIEAPAPPSEEQQDDDEGEDKDDMAVTYLIPRDPSIPCADKAELSKLRQSARGIEDNMDALFFPHLFPSGTGGYQRVQHKKFSEYARKRLLSRDGRFEADPAYIMWLLEEHLKKRLSGNVNVRMKNHLQPASGTQFEGVNRQVFTALRDLPGTQAYLYAKKGVAMSMYEQLGKPHFFLTVTCHARQPNILAAAVMAKLLRQPGNNSITSEELEHLAAEIIHQYQTNEDHTWDGLTANQLCISMPAIIARQFMHGLRQMLHWLTCGEAGSLKPQGGDVQDNPEDEDRAVEDRYSPLFHFMFI